MSRSMKKNIIIKLYYRSMRLGCRAGCHQRTDRSFFFKGYQFPVCARCTGVLIGYLVAIPSYIAWGASLRLCIIFAAIMLLDWVLQYGKLLESTNIRRLLTGICGGYGVLSAQLLFVRTIFRLLIGF